LPRKGTYDLLEIAKRKSAWSMQIAAKDKDYSSYSGASLEIASKMAAIDTFLSLGLIDPKIVAIVKLYRAYLNKQRKAFFASIGSTEVTKLGFILGLKGERKLSF